MAEPGVAPEPRRRSVLCASPKGLHRIAYLEWGDPRNRDALVCVHGLTRTARDFDELARALCGRFRVVCPDLAGRGDSDRLPDPALYALPQYVSDMVTLIARLDVEALSWVGTSLGGLVGQQPHRFAGHRGGRVADQAAGGHGESVGVGDVPAGPAVDGPALGQLTQKGKLPAGNLRQIDVPCCYRHDI